MKFLKISGFALLIGISVYADCAKAQAPAFQGSQFVESNTGYAKLSWDKADDAEFELQRSLSKSFEGARPVYKGISNTVFVSGLKNGRYFYRVRFVKDKLSHSSWSDIKELKVTHHSLKTALCLFLMGLLAFVFTSSVILKGYFQTKEKVSYK